MRRLAILLGAVSLTAPAIANAAEPLVLEPSGPWNIDYSPESCKLGRKFGEGDGAVTAVFMKSAPGPSMQLLAVGKGLKPRWREDIYYLWWPSDSDKPKRAGALFGESDGVTSVLMRPSLIDFPPQPEEPFLYDVADLRRLEQKRIGEVTEFRFVKGLKRPLTLKLGGLSAPMAAMDTCVDALVESWGLDPGVQRNRSRPVMPANDPQSWLKDSDYPKGALDKDSEAVIEFRFLVDDKGAVTRCDTLGTFVESDFSKGLCDLVRKRAQMTPALDANGAPVASYYVGSVRYQMAS